jgi:hypothetical protein
VPIHGHRQLALVALHHGHGHRQVVNDSVNVGQLLLGGLHFGRWWCGHGSSEDEQLWWWGLVVGCAAPVEAKFALNTKVLWLGRLGLKSKVTSSQLGQDQFLLALFIDSSTLYSRLIQSLI